MDITNFLAFLIGAIFIFAIFDLIVGVSNDAINFLAPSIGAKAGKYKVIIIIASLGLLAGALFSSGLMEVARKGIFYPQNFTLVEVTTIFLSVIIADIILLNRFNSMGMPTSTTVSIVFCLLGGAVGMGVIKAYGLGLDITAVSNYINSDKVLTIILGILGSVVASFLLGSLVQYITRMFFTFDYESKPKYWRAILGAISITAISHFVLSKGLKGSVLNVKEITEFVNNNLALFIAMNLIIWFGVLQFLNYLKINIFKLVVLIGTFSLAMAFAGNDLVNFIGVPLAALKSYSLFLADPNILDPNLFYMDGLNKKEKANTILLLIAGLIMVVTLICSKKAKRVLDTGLGLSDHKQGEEKFGKSYISEIVVKQFIGIMSITEKVTPKHIWNKVGARFRKIKGQEAEGHFDLIRASVILICSSILISIATSYKLPLSTTYVTFMVSMGAAFADRAWGHESAVYRVNGVLAVIFGWFMTAFGAFILAFLIANIIHLGGMFTAIPLILLTFFIMVYPVLKIKK